MNSFVAAKDIISVPILCSGRENVKGSYVELYCLVDCPTYYTSNLILFCILMEFGGIFFRLKGDIPHSILTVVDGNKIMLTFSNFRFSLLSGMNIHFIVYVCLFPALGERETSCNAGIQIHCQGLKDEWGLILNKSCLNRAKF